MTTPKAMERANRVSIVPTETGFEARFVRTHKEVARIASTETTWTPDPKMNKTLQREMFRQWICEHAKDYNVDYDPEDRRTDENKMPNKYDSDKLLMDTAARLVRMDITEWVAKIGADTKHAVELVSVEGEEIFEVTMNRKGATVSPKYNSGAWAWATVVVVATVRVDDILGYVSMECSLVSGQLKKPVSIGDGSYTYTGFRNELAKDIPAIAVSTDKKEDTKESKKEDKKTDKPKKEKGSKDSNK